jgi:hypothetical protein
MAEWTDRVPTKPGYYWVRQVGDEREQALDIVEYSEDQGWLGMDREGEVFPPVSKSFREFWDESILPPPPRNFLSFALRDPGADLYRQILSDGIEAMRKVIALDGPQGTYSDSIRMAENLLRKMSAMYKVV